MEESTTRARKGGGLLFDCQDGVAGKQGWARQKMWRDSTGRTIRSCSQPSIIPTYARPPVPVTACERVLIDTVPAFDMTATNNCHAQRSQCYHQFHGSSGGNEVLAPVCFIFLSLFVISTLFSLVELLELVQARLA